MVWNYTKDLPPKVWRGLFIGQWQYTVSYAIETLPADEQDATGYNYRYKTVTLEPGVWTYDAIVDALVTAEYPAAKMQAVINNYLATPDNADIKAEFDAMQGWRKEAKRIAKEALTVYAD